MKKIFLLVINFSLLFAIDASMEIVKKSKNIPSIVVFTQNQSNIAKKVKQTIEEDLIVSGHFDVKRRYKLSNSKGIVDYNQFKNGGVDLFLDIKVKVSNYNKVIVYMTLYDINLNKQVLTKALSISKKDRYPFVGHSIAIIVNKYLKAPSIEWMGEFVVFAKSIGKHRSQIVISDYSLKYQNVIISNGLNVFPKWASSKKDSFYYTSYNEDKPTLYKINIFTGKREKILSSDGMLVCSDVSKDGTKLLLTLAPNDQPDIYLYDIKTKIKKRVTRYNGIDVNGNFVEDDKKVVFISDRLRRPNIFIKSINSRAVKRLVYHGSNNSSCSTFDDYVVYSSKEDTKEFGKRNFNLYLVSTQTDTIQKLTTNGVNQFPKFSFDGESVLFIKNYQDKSYVGIVRLNYNKSFLFPIKVGKLQSIDW